MLQTRRFSPSALQKDESATLCGGSSERGSAFRRNNSLAFLQQTGISDHLPFSESFLKELID